MTSLATSVLTILQILPTLIEAVQKLEVLFPENGIGTFKLSLITQPLLKAIPMVQDLIPMIEKVVGTVVDLFNTAGIFKK